MLKQSVLLLPSNKVFDEYQLIRLFLEIHINGRQCVPIIPITSNICNLLSGSVAKLLYTFPCAGYKEECFIAGMRVFKIPILISPRNSTKFYENYIGLSFTIIFKIVIDISITYSTYMLYNVDKRKHNNLLYRT